MALHMPKDVLIWENSKYFRKLDIFYLLKKRWICLEIYALEPPNDATKHIFVTHRVQMFLQDCRDSKSLLNKRSQTEDYLSCSVEFLLPTSFTQFLLKGKIGTNDAKGSSSPSQVHFSSPVFGEKFPSPNSADGFCSILKVIGFRSKE